MPKHSFNFRSAFDAFRERRASPAVVKRAPGDCGVDSIYKSPKSGSTVNLNDKFTIEWNPSCLPNSVIRIKLTSPSLQSSNGSVGVWANVDGTTGSKEVALVPEQFNNLAKLELQVSISANSEENTPEFLVETLPSGPSWTGIYNKTQPSVATGSGSNGNLLSGHSSSSVTSTSNGSHGGMTKGQVAAAVLVPILFIAACIGAYVFWSRKKEAARRKEYRENLDQRMSIAPGADWAPISAAGAAAAIRHSMAFSGAGDRNTRSSSFFGRQSTYQVDPPQEMRQTRTRNTSTEQSRTSRVSFADSTFDKSFDRPAVPPLPAAYRKSQFAEEKDGETLSPTQRTGAFALDDAAIQDRLSAGEANHGRASVAIGQDVDTLPALAMMRANETSPAAPAVAMTRESTYSIGAYSGNTDSIVTDSNAPSFFNPPSNNADPDEALRNYASRTPQFVPVTTTASPFSGFAAGPGIAAAAGFDMSPDAAFRAYAATRPAAPPTAVAPGAPSTMRTLYGPTMTQGLGLRQRSDTMSTSNNPYRDSMAPNHTGEDIGKAQ
ncbi:SubName: Full=Uncharacterized protein {ECO:0000313/EMBL:CCA68284.1} [Serendipita indica DSM 11827]|nr:SubName: Full=Uncharacterized protein {ECO:0000313/EMBL:CCA68284.1} [Serendipita indica DSM 11827]